MTTTTPAAVPAAAPRSTPLDAVHRALGASMVDFAGWSMPLRYVSETAEHLAVRAHAGLFDLSHMGEIELTGPGAGAALDHAVVSDLSKLVDGKAKYTMLCASDGGVLDDLIVYRLAADHWLVVANAANAATVARELAARASSPGPVSAGTVSAGVRVEDRSEDWALLAVQGPEAAAVVGALTDTDVVPLRYYAISPATVAGVDVLLARTGYTGEDGFEILVRPDGAEKLWSSLMDQGRVVALVPAGLAARDTLRLEAGMPLYGHELSAALTPYDAGLGRVVALDKPGGFVGRDALAARGAAGPPLRGLVGLVGDGRRVPRAGYSVLDERGRPIGEVTSGAPSPTLGRPVAMAYVENRSTVPGTVVSFDVRGRPEPARVVDLPFYKRPRA